MSITLFVTFNGINHALQKEVLSTTKDYIGFQEKVNGLINSNVQLLKGYLAYVKSNEDITEDETYTYLENLTKENEVYIRNIGILKDTTIIYNYPREGNEDAIGIDLSKIEGQREVVLKTKNLLQPVFQGPLELVQGGHAFIVRLPIVDSKEAYWGQVSIVLKADKVIEEIGRYAYDNQLEIGIQTEGKDRLWVYGNEEIKSKNPLEFSISTNMMSWSVYAVPIDGWRTMAVERSLSILLALFILFLSAVTIYYAQKTNYQIKHNSYHDRLTGLFNRHFLDEYQTMIMSAANRNNEMVGMVLVDLNDFKAINDTYGHKVGDLVLVETARLMNKVSRVNEAVFRLGGDEFLIIVPRLVYEDELMVLKDRIEDAFIKEFAIKGYKIDMVPSVGTSIYPLNGQIFDEVLHYADQNMYDEKSIYKKNV